MQPRGFTLIELLIVLALIAGMLALVYPAVHGRLDERAFDSAIEHIESQLLLARAEAIESRRALEVVYIEPGRIEVRPFDDTAPRFDVHNDDAVDFAASARAPQRDEALSRSWASLSLPGDVTMSSRPPLNLRDGSAGESSFDDDVGDLAAFGGRAQEALRLAIYLSDGTSMLSRPVWITDRGGRTAIVQVNPWSGLPAVERITRLAGANGNPRDEGLMHDDGLSVDATR